jgi:hypothetical protein
MRFQGAAAASEHGLREIIAKARAERDGLVAYIKFVKQEQREVPKRRRLSRRGNLRDRLAPFQVDCVVEAVGGLQHVAEGNAFAIDDAGSPAFTSGICVPPLLVRTALP